MKTCATCNHFLKSPQSGVRTGEFVIGQCRATPPVRDWTWNRTRACDYCALHTDNAQPAHFATGTTGPAPLAALTAAAPSTDQAPVALKPATRKSSKPARGDSLFPTAST